MLLSKVGSFMTDTSKTAGQKHYIRGTGFKPKVVLFWWSGAQTLDDVVSANSTTYSTGIGAAISSTSRFCSASFVLADSWAEASKRALRNDSIVRIYAPTGDINNITLDGILDFSAMKNDGFDVVVSTQFYNRAYKISWLALGGSDLTNAYIGSSAMPVTTGEYSVTGVGFQPDFLFVATNDYSGAIPFDNNGGHTGWGWATGASNQGVVSWIANSGTFAHNSSGYGYNGEIFGSCGAYGGGDCSRRESFVEFLSDGFKLNHLEGTYAQTYVYLALKGGKYKVGSLTTRTDTNDIVVDDVDFRPRALMFMSACVPLSTQDTCTANGAVSLGATTTAYGGYVHTKFDKHNGDTSFASYNNKVYASEKEGSIVGLMDLKSVEPYGFTCAMSDADDGTNWVSYLAIGDSSNNESYAHAFMPPKTPEYSTSSTKHAYMNGSGQHFSAKVGSFNIPANGSNGDIISITGLGFEPTMVFFWWSGATGTEDSVAGGDFNIGFGVGMNTNSMFTIGSMSVDNVTTSDNVHWGYTQSGYSVIRFYKNTTTHDGYYELNTMTIDGFDLWTGGGSSKAYRVNYLAIQGVDITNWKLSNKVMPTVNGDYSVTDTGFLPSIVLFATVFMSSLNSYSAHTYFTLGMASADEQGVVSIWGDDAIATTNTCSYCYDNEVMAFAPGVSYRQRLVSMNSNGFTLNMQEKGSAMYFYYMAMKGVCLHVGSFNTRTDGNDISVTGVGFPPKAVLFFSNNRPMSTFDTWSANAAVSIGAFSSLTNRAASAIWEESGLDVSENAYANYSTAVYANVKDDAIVGLMDIKSIDEDGFTCVMDDPDPEECWVTYMAFGSTLPAFMRSTQHAWVYGHDPNGLEIRAYTRGLDFANDSQAAWLAGGIKVSSSVPAYTLGLNPSIVSKAGSFNIDISKTVGQTMTISGVTFEPRLVLFWQSGTLDNVYNTYWNNEDAMNIEGDVNFGFGAAIDSTNRFAVVGYNQIGASLSSSNSYRSQNNTEVVRTYIPSGAIPTVDGILDFDSMNSDGFSVIVDNQFSYPYRISYLAIGGEDFTDAYIGNTTLPTVSGTFDIIDLEFQPSALIVVTQKQTSVIEEGEHALLSLGWATASGQQGVVSYRALDNVTTTSAISHVYNHEIYACMDTTASGIDVRGEFVEFLPSGFRLNHTQGLSAYQLYYIALKGGIYVAGSTHALENYDETHSEDGIGTYPTTLLTAGTFNLLGTVNTIYGDANIGIGAATVLGQVAQGMSIMDNRTLPYNYTNVLGSINTGYYVDPDYQSGLLLLHFDENGWTYQAPEWWYSDDEDWINYLAIGATTTLSSKTNTPAYMYGQVSIRSWKHAYMNTILGAVSNVPVYMDTILGASTSVPAWLTGPRVADTVVHAYMEGVPIRTSQYAYMYGQVNIATSKSVYMNAIQYPIFGPQAWTT